VPDVWEVPGVLGAAQTPAPEVPAQENAELLSLASDIAPWQPAQNAAAVPDLAATVDAAPRGKWMNWKSFGGSLGAFRNAAVKTWTLVVSGLERVRPLGEPSLRWLTRGAAIVSAISVVALFMVHRADLFSTFNRDALVTKLEKIDLSQIDLTTHLDRVKQKVTAATTRPAPPPPPPLPRGMGRLTITSSNDDPLVFVDGRQRGKAPVTVILMAGTHHLQLRSAKGQIEKTVRVEAGESSEMDESIFPGWVAVAAAVDLTISENGRALKKDERGWAILPPGPHDIRLDNNQLGIHETRHVVVTPGDATHISLAPPGSTLSIAANEPAEVWVDGTSLGEAPVTDAPVKLGMHDVRVRSASHEKWLRVRVTTQPAQLNVDLTAE